MMPQLVTVKVHSGRGRRFRVWIPILPVLLVLSPLLILVMVVLAVACLVYRVNPGRAFAASWGLLSGLRGLRVDLQQGRTDVLVKIT
jgi:hypothetical protein